MRDWDVAIPALERCLSKHFPDVDEARIKEAAEDLHSSSGAAHFVEHRANNNRSPQKDLDDINRAINSLRLAAKHLGKSGIHGMRSLRILAGEIQQRRLQLPSNNYRMLKEHELLPLVSAEIAELADKIEACSLNIDPNNFAIFPDEWGEYTPDKPGAKEAYEAYSIATECAKWYEQFTGRRPSLGWNEPDSKRYGPFLDMVTGVFKALGIENSPAASAEKVVEELRLKTKT